MWHSQRTLREQGHKPGGAHSPPESREDGLELDMTKCYNAKHPVHKREYFGGGEIGVNWVINALSCVLNNGRVRVWPVVGDMPGVVSEEAGSACGGHHRCPWWPC